MSVAEYGRIFKADEDRSLDDGNLLLRQKHFDALLTLLDSGDDEAPD